MALDVSKGIAHLDHIEDLVLLYGKDGAKIGSETVSKFIKKFEKDSEESGDLTISEKIDGAPSLYFGTAPDGRFFVGTKGVLSKGEQKIAYGLSDIRRLYQGGVEDVLAQSYNALRGAFKEKGMACQGDLLWYNKSGKTETNVHGKPMLTFQPNTIMYGIPTDPKSDTYKKASRAILGIVIHGAYETNFVEGERVEFSRQGIDKVRELAEAINQNPNVFCIHPYVDNVDALVGNEETVTELDQTLKSVHDAQNQIDPAFDKEWKRGENDLIKMAKAYLPQFVNQQVRASGEEETILTAKDEKEFLKRFNNKFREFVAVKGKGEIEKMKSLKGKEQKSNTYKDFGNWMKKSNKTFEPMFLCFFRLFNVKSLMIQLLDKIEKKLGQTFVVDRKGDFDIKAVKPEGYVFLSGDNMVKIVDRLEFSRNNFLYSRFNESQEEVEAKPTLTKKKSINDSIEEDVLSAMEAIQNMGDDFSDQTVVEAASKMQGYNAVYVGRFQPPTVAHSKNIDDLAKAFGNVYVLVSKAENQSPKYLQKNPLSDEERIKILKSDPKIRNHNNVHIVSGPTYLAYGVLAPNAETGKPNEVELKKILGMPQESIMALALGQEDDRYYDLQKRGTFFDINKGEQSDKKKKVGLYGIKLQQSSGEEGKISASTIRDAIVNGDLDTAENLLAGSDALKQNTIETIRDKLNMINKALEKPTKAKKAIKRLSEDVDDEEGIDSQMEETLDIMLNILEE